MRDGVWRPLAAAIAGGAAASGGAAEIGADDPRAGRPSIRALCPDAADVVIGDQPLGLKVGELLPPGVHARLARERAGTIRILQGMAFGTMDFVPGRLTIILSDDGVIRSLRCG